MACWSMPRLHLLRLPHRIGSGQLLPLTMENVIRATLVVKGPYHLPARGHKSVQIIMIRPVTPFRYFYITNPEVIIKEFGRPPCVDTSIVSWRSLLKATYLLVITKGYHYVTMSLSASS